MNSINKPHMLRAIGIICLAAALASLISGCVRKPDDVLIKPRSKQIVESKLDEKVILLVTENYIPYGFEENGIIKGIAVDVLNEAFARQGYGIELKMFPWTRSLQMVEDGDTDGIFCAFYSEERAVYMQYLNEPIASEAQYVYTLKDSPVKFDGTLNSLKPYRIGVIQDWFYGADFEAAVKARTLNVEEVTDLPINLQKLLDGRIDAIVNPHLSTLYYLKQMNIQDKVIEQSIPFREPSGLYLAFTKKRFVDQELIRKIDEELVRMKTDGTYQKIIDRYTR